MLELEIECVETSYLIRGDDSGICTPTNYQEREQVSFNLLPKYLSDYFRRNHSFHSYNTRRRENIHPVKTQIKPGEDDF